MRARRQREAISPVCVPAHPPTIVQRRDYKRPAFWPKPAVGPTEPPKRVEGRSGSPNMKFLTASSEPSLVPERANAGRLW